MHDFPSVTLYNGKMNRRANIWWGDFRFCVTNLQLRIESKKHVCRRLYKAARISTWMLCRIELNVFTLDGNCVWNCAEIERNLQILYMKLAWNLIQAWLREYHLLRGKKHLNGSFIQLAYQIHIYICTTPKLETTPKDGRKIEKNNLSAAAWSVIWSQREFTVSTFWKLPYLSGKTTAGYR